MVQLTDSPTSVPVAAPQVRASLFLERALLLTFVLHGLAMLAMALLLLPGTPGGGVQSVAERMHYIAANPWLWRIGWFAWQATALSDLVLALALLRTRWIPRPLAIFTLVTTIAAIVPDQLGQGLWVTGGVALAQSNDVAAYTRVETSLFNWIAAWGAIGYATAAIGWTLCFRQLNSWRRAMSVFSCALWCLFYVVGVSPLLPETLRPASTIVAAGNAIGFVLLMLWFAIVIELVLRRSRPAEAYGRYATWQHPHPGPWHLLDLFGNARLLRRFGEFIPVVSFASDIRNVIYINYLVEADRLVSLVPSGLELQRLGPDGKYALFTLLTYRHGHFGPAFLGPFRRLLPSPIQSNWRVYVTDPRTGQDGVYFVTTVISNTVYALFARFLSEGVPMHVPAKAELTYSDNSYTVIMEPGKGSAPDVYANLKPGAQHPTNGAWQTCFATYRDFLAYCVPQDRALSVQPWYGRTTQQAIALGIGLDECEPLASSVVSRAAEKIVGDAEPICFRVDSVHFRLNGETHSRFSAH